MKVKVNELSGAALDWAVAICCGEVTDFESDGITYGFKLNGKTKVLAAGWAPSMSWQPSTDWAQGGKIVEREGIGLLFDAGSACRSPSWFATPDDQSTQTSYEGENFDPTFMVDEGFGVRGPTPLIAAMRVFVASKLGNEVEIPEELV